MKLNKNLYLYGDASISCAGRTRDGSLQQALINPEYKPNFQKWTWEDSSYPVAMIPDYLLNLSEDKLRIEALLDEIIKDVAPSVADCIERYGAQRVGVCAGSCDNGSEDSLQAHKKFFDVGSFPPDYKLCQQSPAQVAAYLQNKLGTEGPAITVATACASSATALIEAAQLIQAGICDAVVVAGVDLVSPTVFLGFNSLEAVSPAGCNPFSKNRRGISLGEAAACLIVSKDKPNTENYVELLGFGESADANHMTAPLETGEGAAQAMEAALFMAGINKEDISYVNLHGTGTPLNDAMESRAIAQVFGQESKVKVSSTKAITGHTLGAAGCLEISICMRTLYDNQIDGKLPIHRWDGEKDEALPGLQFVQAGDKKRTSIFMSNSFAFGGCNTSIIIGKPKE